MAHEQQEVRSRNNINIHGRADKLDKSEQLKTRIEEASEVAAISSFGKAIPSSLVEEAQKTDGYVATDVSDDVSDPSTGVYQMPHTRESIILGTMPAPGTGVEHNATDAGIKPAEGAKDRPGKLEAPAADESRLSSRIINAQGYTTPSPSELQNEKLTASKTTRNDFPSVKECLEQLKLVPKLFDRLDEKTIDMKVKFGKRQVALAGRLPLAQTLEKPNMYLRKHGLVTAEDVYLLLLIAVDLTRPGNESNLYLQWMVQDVRLPSGSPEVDVVCRLGREMFPYAPCGVPGGCGAVYGHALLLYQQDKPLPSNITNKIQREGFEPKAFIDSQQLDHPHPVQAFYYETQ